VDQRRERREMARRRVRTSQKWKALGMVAWADSGRCEMGRRVPEA
jgi:hypothetical protein